MLLLQSLKEIKMYNGNSNYKNKMLNIIDNENPKTGFVMSSPSKISLKKGHAFSLPAGPDFSCPGATEACKDCYAQKGRHIFSNVQKAFASNWKLMKEYRFKGDAQGCAQALLKAMPQGTVFRIHESGDFEDDFAVNVWTQVAKARPSTKFWAYTRSFNFDFHDFISLPNVMLWASTDSFNELQAKEFVIRHPGTRHAYGPIINKNDLQNNSFICPVTSGKLSVEGACQSCMLCVDKNRTSKHVAFLKH